MLKAFFYGAAAAIIGSKLKKMNDEGRLEPYKEQARQRIQDVKGQLKEQTVGRSRSAKSVPGNNVSAPAPAHPWPVDRKAMPSN